MGSQFSFLPRGRGGSTGLTRILKVVQAVLLVLHWPCGLTTNKKLVFWGLRALLGAIGRYWAGTGASTDRPGSVPDGPRPGRRPGPVRHRSVEREGIDGGERTDLRNRQISFCCFLSSKPKPLKKKKTHLGSLKVWAGLGRWVFRGRYVGKSKRVGGSDFLSFLTERPCWGETHVVSGPFS